MGEWIFSLFVGTYFASVGVFMNWYLKREMKKATQQKNTDKEGSVNQ